MGNSTSCRFVLASGSPRRKEMVEWLGIPFSIKTIPIEEVSSCEHPREKAMDIAEKKCFALRNWLEDEKLERAVVLAADTMVSKGEQCFGKPSNEDEARKTLGILSGTTHAVYTGVFLGFWEKGLGFKETRAFCEETEVEFYPIPQDLLNLYMESGEYRDKAGAYGIQGQALTFIKKITGSYSNVVGLPLSETIQEIKKLFPKELEGQSLKSLFS